MRGPKIGFRRLGPGEHRPLGSGEFSSELLIAVALVADYGVLLVFLDNAINGGGQTGRALKYLIFRAVAQWTVKLCFIPSVFFGEKPFKTMRLAPRHGIAESDARDFSVVELGPREVKGHLAPKLQADPLVDPELQIGKAGD